MTSPPALSADAVVDALDLVPNAAGGWYRQVHEVPAPDGGRAVASVINYLVDARQPVAILHRMSADSLHYFHQGGALAVVMVDPGGTLHRAVLGADLQAGQQLQVMVPGGWWKGFELLDGAWSLIGEAVAPGWTIDDHEDATAALLDAVDADVRAEIQRFVSA